MKKFYIYFPNSDNQIENFLIDKKSCNSFIEEIQMTVDRISCEIDTDLFYDKSNKDNFAGDLKALNELIQIGHFDIEEVLNIMIIDNGIKNALPKKEIIYKYSILENKQILEEEPSNLLKVITENKFNNIQECYFVGFTNPTFPISHEILISRNDTKNEPIIFNIGFIKGFQIDVFFNDINNSRKLNRKDFRHCENHADFIKGKSPLIAGTNGFDNAHSLLNSAIGDIKTGKRILINTDTNNQNHIIRFENENFNDQYHAYHMVKRDGVDYVENNEKMQILKSRKKGVPRAFKLLEYREKINN